MQNYEKYDVELGDGIHANEDINPSRYIDLTIQRALQCLNKENIEAGFFQFIILINCLENECSALKIISTEYYERIAEYKKSEEYNEKSSFKYGQSMKLAEKKFGLLMSYISESRMVETPLGIRKDDINALDK